MALVDLLVYDGAATPPVIRPPESSDVVAPFANSYEHNQVISSYTWYIQHNLGSKQLDIKIFLSNGQEVVGDPDWANATNNLISVRFSRGLVGKAYVRVV
jgi:hypothetical protein